MTTTQTNPKATTSNGATKVRRARKPLTAKSAGIKIADILEALSPEDRRKAMHIAQTLSASETTAS